MSIHGRRKAERAEKDLRRRIDAQKGKSEEFRPDAKTDAATGNEISRTGRDTPETDLKGMDRRVQEEGIEPEIADEGRTQNSGGGLGNL